MILKLIDKNKEGVFIIPKMVGQKRSRYSDSPVLIINQAGWYGHSFFFQIHLKIWQKSSLWWHKKVIDYTVNHKKHIARKVSFPMEKERESYLQVAMSAPVKLMEEDEDQCKNCTFAVSADHFYTVAFYGWHWFLMRSISLQSRRLLVVDPCGGAHGGRSCRSRSLLSLHRAAPPRADPGEPRSGQIWNRHHELSLSSGSNKHLRRVADFHPQRVNILVALSPFTFRCLFIIIFLKFVDFWKTLQMLLFFFLMPLSFYC